MARNKIVLVRVCYVIVFLVSSFSCSLGSNFLFELCDRNSSNGEMLIYAYFKFHLESEHYAED